MRLRSFFAALFLGLASVASAQPAAAPAKPSSYVAAVVVSNRAGADFEEKASALDDLLSARLADLGFQLISRELVTGGLRSYAPGAATDQASVTASAAAEAAFIDQSSAVRLAQNLGADYLLHATLVSYAKTERQVTAYGNTLNNYDYTLRVAYKILDAQNGGALTGDVVTATHTEQGNANSTALVGGIFENLLNQASEKITASLRVRRDTGRIAAAKPAAKQVTITLAVEAADLHIPDVRINAEKVVTIGDSKFKVAPLNATVEIDGVAVGTAPGKITLKPGFSRLRLSREGFTSWERTISASEGQTLTIAMTMSPEGLERFRESTAFLNELKNDAKLTDAEVKVLEGKAKSLENSFFKVDTKENFRFILPPGYSDSANQQQTTIINK